MKDTMKRCEKAFYNMGFTDAKNPCGVVVFKAWQLRFSKGLMAAVNALNLPKSSSFKDPTQIPLPKMREIALA